MPPKKRSRNTKNNNKNKNAKIKRLLQVLKRANQHKETLITASTNILQQLKKKKIGKLKTLKRTQNTNL